MTEVSDEDLSDWELLDARLLAIAGSTDPNAWEELAADLLDAYYREEEAERCSRMAVDLGQPGGWFYLGLALDRLDRLEEAVEAYEMAIVEGIDNAILNQGVVFEQLGRVDDARRRYLQGVEAGDPLGHIRLGCLDKQTGDRESAEERFRLALAAGWPSAASYLGVLLAEDERWKDAEPHLAAVSELDGEANARSWYGVVLHRLGRPAEARRLLEQAVDADELESLMPLGNLLWEKYGDLDGAEVAYRRADAECDTNASLNLGNLLFVTGRFDEARAKLLEYLQHYPGDPRAIDTLNAIERTEEDDVGPIRPDSPVD